jgi:predicted lipase
MVHGGFYDAYQDISPQVIDAVSGYLNQYPSAQISITGHSFGAALATFAAIDIIDRLKPFFNQVNFYTFGSPRTGNQAFTDYIFALFPNGKY